MNVSCPGILSRRKLSDEDRMQIHKVFKECDSENKGYLSKEDVKVAVLSIFGYKPSKYEVQQLMGIGSKEKFEGLSLDRFQSVMSAKLSLEDSDQEIRQMFNSFDIKCKGFLTKSDIESAFLCIAPNLPKSTVSACFQNMDRDADGRISFRDFERCMRFDMENYL